MSLFINFLSSFLYPSNVGTLWSSVKVAVNGASSSSSRISRSIPGALFNPVWLSKTNGFVVGSLKGGSISSYTVGVFTGKITMCPACTRQLGDYVVLQVLSFVTIKSMSLSFFMLVSTLSTSSSVGGESLFSVYFLPRIYTRDRLWEHLDASTFFFAAGVVNYNTLGLGPTMFTTLLLGSPLSVLIMCRFTVTRSGPKVEPAPVLIIRFVRCTHSCYMSGPGGPSSVQLYI